MKRYIWLIGITAGYYGFLCIAFAALGDPTPSPTPPADVADAVELVKEGYLASKLGGMGWVVLSIAFLKAFWLAVGRIKELKAKFVKWGVEINVVLAAMIAILAMVVGKASWTEILVVAATGPLMGFVHDLAKLVWNLKKKNDPEAEFE